MSDRENSEADNCENFIPATIEEVVSFEQWLHMSGYERIYFDNSYIDYLLRGFRGQRYFSTIAGESHSITTVLNFLPADSSHPLSDYSVPNTWGLISDRMGMYLMPFAELFGGDMLCFDYQKDGRPQVVVWYHDRSRPGQDPYTEPVASNFDDFIELLRNTP